MDEPVVSTEVADLSRVTLTDLRDLEDPALNECLRRVLADTDRSHDAVAGFNSSL